MAGAVQASCGQCQCQLFDTVARHDGCLSEPTLDLKYRSAGSETAAILADGETSCISIVVISRH